MNMLIIIWMLGMVSIVKNAEKIDKKYVLVHNKNKHKNEKILYNIL